MVSVPIGGVRVDLQLNSAAFIRDIAKSSAATAKATGAMSKSLSGVQSSIATINKTMLAFLGAREIKKVINFTEQCLKLASTIKGPLGDSARAFTNAATNMSNSFKLGVAQGFLDAVNAGLQESGVSLQQLASAGIIVGNILGRVFTNIVNFFTHDIPEGIKTSINSLNVLANAYNEMAAARDAAAGQGAALTGGAAGTGLLGGGETGSRIPIVDTSAIVSSIKVHTDFANTQNVVAGALQNTAKAHQGVAAATKASADAARAHTSIIEATRTPLETYAAALEKIKLANVSSEIASRATSAAQQELATSYVGAAQQITGTLTQAFEGNKAIQIANALVNAAAAIVQALSLPFPLNWAQVAAVGALAATQIAAIRSAKPGGGGNVKTSAGGGKSNKGVKSAGAASTAAAPAAGGGAGFTQAVTIEILGDVFGPEHFRKIVAGINDVQRDGTALLRIA